LRPSKFKRSETVAERGFLFERKHGIGGGFKFSAELVEKQEWKLLCAL
jgi:hypothetical protein